MAEPMFGQDAVAFYLLGEQVSKEIKVVQSGQGADEVFGGYFWYPRMLADDLGTPVEGMDLRIETPDGQGPGRKGRRGFAPPGGRPQKRDFQKGKAKERGNGSEKTG